MFKGNKNVFQSIKSFKLIIITMWTAVKKMIIWLIFPSIQNQLINIVTWSITFCLFSSLQTELDQLFANIPLVNNSTSQLVGGLGFVMIHRHDDWLLIINYRHHHRRFSRTLENKKESLFGYSPPYPPPPPSSSTPQITNHSVNQEWIRKQKIIIHYYDL